MWSSLLDWALDKAGAKLAWLLMLMFALGFGAMYFLATLLQSQRDTARAEVATLTKQLATECAVSEGLAQVAKDAANQASAQASATLVQKNREITAQNSSLKKEIKNVYANTAPSLAQNHTNISAAGGYALPASGDGDGGTCFGAEFGRLWNAANTLRGSETAAP